jgi:DNA-binding LacI/PurR family transcriptional regulator
MMRVPATGGPVVTGDFSRLTEFSKARTWLRSAQKFSAKNRSLTVMEPLRKKSVIDQAEAVLAEELRRARWRGALPGVRALALDLGLSQPTVLAALARLAACGLVERGGPRRPYRVPVAAGTADERGGVRRLLFLTDGPEFQAGHFLRQLIDELQRRRGDWSLRCRETRFQRVARPLRVWERLLQTEAPDLLVAVAGSPVLARWCRAGRMPVVFLGGDRGGEAVPMLALSATRMLRESLERLVGLGHRRICLPLCGRMAGFTARLHRVFAEVLGAAGQPFAPAFHTPEVAGKTPGDLIAVLERIWRVRAPTALVVLDWGEFVAASCFLRDRGVRIPQNLSVVMLGDDPALHWHLPRLAHFQPPLGPCATTLLRWAVQLPPDGTRVSLTAPFVAGESLAAPE